MTLEELEQGLTDPDPEMCAYLVGFHHEKGSPRSLAAQDRGHTLWSWSVRPLFEF